MFKERSTSPSRGGVFVLAVYHAQPVALPGLRSRPGKVGLGLGLEVLILIVVAVVWVQQGFGGRYPPSMGFYEGDVFAGVLSIE